ncbi:MAG: N-acetyl-gamma-glutamyl-phosphate reductase [Oscillospiraceae bacterium]|jgi:N-acetyl-gamma-glutamyl-phosphate reductase|nr:N-acetyl-gamma-glutamyl-phosphate reductase [Oscillospiraceae bacterium]
MHTVFIDGAQGTTGLRLRERLAARSELQLIQLPEPQRKDAQARRAAMQSAEITFLCLPDAAAVESAQLAVGTRTRIIDASTAHRTAPGWVYGFPELMPGQREKIAAAQRVAVPGCHASGFAALVAPLRQAGLLPADAALGCFSVTGYSGGGKGMMAEYADPARPAAYDAPRAYALDQTHKHLREIVHVCALATEPVFVPIVGDFPYGMAVMIGLHAEKLGGLAALTGAYRAHYAHCPAVRVITTGEAAPDGFLSANTLAGRDSMEIVVSGNDQRAVLTARFDNLGKGASGAAVQCMNLMLDLPEFAGLAL